MNPSVPDQPQPYAPGAAAPGYAPTPQPAVPVATTASLPSAPYPEQAASIPQQQYAYTPPQAPDPALAFGQPPLQTQIAATPPPIDYSQYPQPVPVAATPTPPAGAPKVKAAQANPNSTQNMLQIAEIRDGIVIMSDGSYRSVVMVKSINFDLMSPQEQEAVEYSYQGFLNSLYFPIQIFIRSEKVDLQPYIEKLDKIRTEHDNMLLALLMEDYIGYIDSLSRQTNIMDKRFYVVVPFFPNTEVQKAFTQSKNFFSGLTSLFTNNKNAHVVINEADLEHAKEELRNRVQSVLSGLLQCNIQGLPLDTQELIELFYDTYNPDTATRQELKNFNEMTADIITKGDGTAVQAHLQRELQ
jgi:hypothetical protein